MAKQKQEEPRMLFHEVGKGNFFREVQQEFEKALVIASKHHCKVPVKMQIIIHPPKIIPGVTKRFGEIEYCVTPVVAKYQSARYTVELDKDGLAISEGVDVLDCLQEDMFSQADEQIPEQANSNQVVFPNQKAV